ncbi:MAG TPA: VOC family protein [Candidatus Binataceae bacterium]|nr:VOC family protein [Candidatus Binataceae bacterium]
MAGIDHLMINANRYEASVKFYSWLMPLVGYPEKHEFGGDDPMIGFAGPGGSLWLSNSASNLRSDNFNKRRVGLREIAFRADNRAQVDTVAQAVESNGGKILDPPAEYPQYRKGYYSVFFTDPDGLKLEVVTYSE